MEEAISTQRTGDHFIHDDILTIGTSTIVFSSICHLG